LKEAIRVAFFSVGKLRKRGRPGEGEKGVSGF
jgi:hypothetical protein